jgi:RND family efflux transporter MFP subunit
MKLLATLDASGIHRVILVCAFVAVVGCNQTPEINEAVKRAARPVRVKTVLVMQQDVARATTQPATVVAYHQAEIRARVRGYIKDVKVEIGDVVEAGEELAIVDVPEMQQQRLIHEARIARYVAEESSAAAGVELAKAVVTSSEAKLAQAKSELGRADASLAAAEAKFVRTEDLVNRKSLEMRALDEVRKERDSELANKAAAAFSILSADAEVAVAKAKQKSAVADLAAAEAETTIARRQLDELDVLIGFATLKAPFAGVVNVRRVDPGDLVRDSSDTDSGHALFVVSQIDRVRIQIPVPEAVAAHVGKGDNVTITFPSFSGEPPLEETITRVAESLDPSTRTMLVEVEVKNPGHKLLPGMFGQASISLSTRVAANMLPARAVRFDEKGAAYVYLVSDQNKISIVPVTTGLDDGISIEIVTGLKPGQKVVDAHLKRFKEDQQVEVLLDKG